jgi:hypothetical protein
MRSIRKPVQPLLNIMNSPRAGGNPSKNKTVPPRRDTLWHSEASDIFAEIIPEPHSYVKS